MKTCTSLPERFRCNTLLKKSLNLFSRYTYLFIGGLTGVGVLVGSGVRFLATRKVPTPVVATMRVSPRVWGTRVWESDYTHLLEAM